MIFIIVLLPTNMLFSLPISLPVNELSVVHGIFNFLWLAFLLVHIFHCFTVILFIHFTIVKYLGFFLFVFDGLFSFFFKLWAFLLWALWTFSYWFLVHMFKSSSSLGYMPERILGPKNSTCLTLLSNDLLSFPKYFTNVYPLQQ